MASVVESLPRKHKDQKKWREEREGEGKREGRGRKKGRKEGRKKKYFGGLAEWLKW
jgi:hypothetical protein